MESKERGVAACSRAVGVRDSSASRQDATASHQQLTGQALRGFDADADPREADAKRKRTDGEAWASHSRGALVERTKALLEALPAAHSYETSYMHRCALTHTLATKKTHFVLTASADGVLKFWKKQPTGIEFVKQFQAHLAPLAGLAATPDGALLATTSADRGLKVFDIPGYDMIVWLKLGFAPAVCEWLSQRSSATPLLAVAEAEVPVVRILNAAAGEDAVLHQVRVHMAPVLQMRYSEARDAVVSVDERGVIEYWSAAPPFGLPAVAAFQRKMQTDLYAIAKARARPTSLALSPDGEHFVVCATDHKVRLFDFSTGRTLRTYDESPEHQQLLQSEGDDAYRLEPIDFGRRLAVEREYRASAAAGGSPPSNALYDATGKILIIASLFGIKMIAWESSRLLRIVGKVECAERFCGIALFQGTPRIDASLLGQGSTQGDEEDPTLICCAHTKHRFYLFSNREPANLDSSTQVGRDIFNEKPTRDDIILAGKAGDDDNALLPRHVCINTSLGEVHLKLFAEECPRTVENFTTHARKGYYDGVIFHRVIKGFMCQTGDPLGDGTGGTSIWGREFEDEIHRSLRHDRPYTVSMANAGPDTNGSQFFITTVATPWLDGKHTVFGRVVEGMDVVRDIEKAKCDKSDKPYDDIRILSIVCVDE